MTLFFKNTFEFSKNAKLVLIRHGESLYNKEKRWAGWKDVRLSNKGIEQAKECGKMMKQNNLIFQEAYSSVLTRSIQTLNIILDQLQLHYIPIHKTWRLNQKNYGALTGQNKISIAQKYGQKQVAQWRRSFDLSPPKIDINDNRHPIHDRRYNQINRHQLPSGQNQNDVINRIIPLWENQIHLKILEGKNILVSAHGGSLRALVKIISKLSDLQIKELNFPNTTPIVYNFDLENKKYLESNNFQYLGDQQIIKKKMQKIKNQVKRNSSE